MQEDRPETRKVLEALTGECEVCQGTGKLKWTNVPVGAYVSDQYIKCGRCSGTGTPPRPMTW